MNIIERSRPSCQTLFEKWSRFSWQSSAAPAQVYFTKLYMKFTFRGFSEGTLALPLTSSELEEQFSPP
jgi:hypothetical protein